MNDINLNKFSIYLFYLDKYSLFLLPNYSKTNIFQQQRQRKSDLSELV